MWNSLMASLGLDLNLGGKGWRELRRSSSLLQLRILHLMPISTSRESKPRTLWLCCTLDSVYEDLVWTSSFVDSRFFSHSETNVFLEFPLLLCELHRRLNFFDISDSRCLFRFEKMLFKSTKSLDSPKLTVCSHSALTNTARVLLEL